MTLFGKIAMPDSPLSKKICGRCCCFSGFKSVFFLLVSILLLVSNNCTSHFSRETANKSKKSKELETAISNSYLGLRGFSGYRYKSGIVTFAWRVS